MTVVCILFAERILKRKDESKCFFGRVSFSPLGGKRFAPFMLRMKKNMRSLSREANLPKGDRAQPERSHREHSDWAKPLHSRKGHSPWF